MSSPNHFLITALAFILFAPSVYAQKAEDGVVDLQEQILNTAEKSYRERYRDLAPLVNRHFDIQTMLGVILGKRKDDLPRGAWNRLEDVFVRYYIGNLALEATAMKNGHFQKQGLSREGGRRITYRSLWVSRNGERREFTYILARTGGQWRIINRSTDGISTLAVLRTQFLNDLKQGSEGKGQDSAKTGLKAFVTRLENKIEQRNRK